METTSLRCTHIKILLLSQLRLPSTEVPERSTASNEPSSLVSDTGAPRKMASLSEVGFSSEWVDGQTILFLRVVRLLASVVEQPAHSAQPNFQGSPSIPHARAAGTPTGRSLF
jgi:hypothetical protein